MFDKDSRVLVIAAHPDDEILGCGGTMARLALNEEIPVAVAMITDGVISRTVDDRAKGAVLVKARQEQAYQANAILGVDELYFFDLPDQQLDSIPLLRLTKLVEDIIAKVKPTHVFTQHGGDLNFDHAAVYRAVLTATRPLPGSLIKTVLAYPVLSSSEWSFGSFSPAFTPNVFIDITTTIGKKLAAMNNYGAEVKMHPHPRSVKIIDAQARLFGSTVGVRWAEAFQLIRQIV